jgi:hypothetical protein
MFWKSGLYFATLLLNKQLPLFLEVCKYNKNLRTGEKNQRQKLEIKKIISFYIFLNFNDIVSIIKERPLKYANRLIRMKASLQPTILIPAKRSQAIVHFAGSRGYWHVRKV